MGFLANLIERHENVSHWVSTCVRGCPGCEGKEVPRRLQAAPALQLPGNLAGWAVGLCFV